MSLLRAALRTLRAVFGLSDDDAELVVKVDQECAVDIFLARDIASGCDQPRMSGLSQPSERRAVFRNRTVDPGNRSIGRGTD